MKTFLKLILLAIIGISSLNVSAASNQKYFYKLANNPNFDYSYVSPLMLQAMGEGFLSTENSAGLPVKSSDLTSIETIVTNGDGTNEDLWKIITNLKKDKKLETLTTKKKDYYRYDVFAKLSGDKKFITNLLVITQNGGENVSVVYMEGKIPLNSLQYSLAY